LSATLVDSNVLLDILTEDKRWSNWSIESLARLASDGALAINPIIYGEVSVHFQRIEDVDAALLPSDFQRLSLPWEAAFLAGKVYLKYKRAGGAKTSPLPDFYIGAHAAVSGLRLLTRDAKRYSTYFPRLELVSP
jgi:hypothetical protein